MDKKYYRVRYSDRLNMGEKILGERFISSIGNVSTLVREYELGYEIYYEKEKVRGLFGGTEEKNVKKKRRIPRSYFDLYVEEIDGKYYDIITGEEVIRVENLGIPNGCLLKKIEDFETLNSDLNLNLLKSGKLAVSIFKPADERDVYHSFKGLSETEINVYFLRFKTLQENAKKLSAKRLEMIYKGFEYEIKAEEDQRKFMDEFNKTYGYQRRKKF